MKIILSTILETISTRNDGSVKLSLSTQEIDSSKAGELFQMRGKFIKCLLSDSNITSLEEKIVDEETIQDGKRIKTQSQRMRAVLYRVWETTTQQQDFDMWYKAETEKIIEHYKQKLD